MPWFLTEVVGKQKQSSGEGLLSSSDPDNSDPDNDGQPSGRAAESGATPADVVHSAPEPAPLAKPVTSYPLAIDGKPLQTADDVALFLEDRLANLTYILYRAPDNERYVHFEIPKRTGGVRLISSPNGRLRRYQNKLNPLLQQAYRVHPASHGFLRGRSPVTNAEAHVGRKWVLNVDLADFFPSINFGRVRGLFMAPPFSLGDKAATVLAQICTENNGLPQGASTSPVLSNFIANALDRKLMRLARENRMHYSRYADDLTFSTNQPQFPPGVALVERAQAGNGEEGGDKGRIKVKPGGALQAAIEASGFAINEKKLRVQAYYQRQSVTGITVNTRTNVERTRIRRLRAMLHAWEKFGLDAAAREHALRYRHQPEVAFSKKAAKVFRASVYGELAYVKMVRGMDDPVFLKLCSRLASLDPTPSKFLRQMVFGADDYDIFISHATEDKPEIARPILQACEKLGLKAFLDEEHIGWGENFTKKINTALGAARTILCVVSSNSVTKTWPVAEVNAALDLEIMGKKKVLVVMVGKPDLSALPLVSAKNYHIWKDDPETVAQKLKETIHPPEPAASNKDAGRSRRSGYSSKTGALGTSVPGVSSIRRSRWWWPF